MKIVSLEVGITVSGQESQPVEYRANQDFRVVGGTVEIFDNNGKVFEDSVHDDITIELKIDGTQFEVGNRKVSAFALKTLLKPGTFVPFIFQNNTTMYMKFKHTAAGVGAATDVPITVKVILHLVPVTK